MQTPTLNELVLRYSQTPQRTRLGAAAGIVCAIFVLYYFLINQDQQAALAAAQGTLQATESQRAEKFAYAANLSLYEGRLKELTEHLEGARAMLPDTADVPQFLSQIGAIAREVNLVIERFEPQPEVPLDFYAETRFAVQARGSYHDIGAFLDRISHMDRIVNVSDLTMEEPKVKNLRVVVTSHFMLRAFRSMTADEMAAAQEAATKKDGK
jgi:type IV pilus assembly protein PilO